MSEIFSTGFIVFLVGVVGVFVLDLLRLNKNYAVVPAAIVLALMRPDALSSGIAEALPTTLFLVGVVLAANGLQEGGGLVQMGRHIDNKWKFAAFVFVSSMIFDNTIASVLAISMALPIGFTLDKKLLGGPVGNDLPTNYDFKKNVVNYGIWIGLLALLGGLATPIGDVTSALAWMYKKMSIYGLLTLMPAAIIGAIYVTRNTDVLLDFTPKQNKSDGDSVLVGWTKFAIGVALFISIPFAERLHLHVQGIEVTQPGILACVVAVLMFLILRFIFKAPIGIIPSDKHERKDIIKMTIFIFSILCCIGMLHHELEVASPMIARTNIFWIAILTVFISYHVDNIPWTMILIAVVPYAQDSAEWSYLVILLGLAGAGTPIASTTTLLVSSATGMGFKEYYSRAGIIFKTIGVVLLVATITFLVIGKIDIFSFFN